MNTAIGVRHVVVPRLYLAAKRNEPGYEAIYAAVLLLLKRLAHCLLLST